MTDSKVTMEKVSEHGSWIVKVGKLVLWRDAESGKCQLADEDASEFACSLNWFRIFASRSSAREAIRAFNADSTTQHLVEGLH